MSPKEVLADTGPLYASVDPSDGYHRRAREEIGRLNREGVSVAVAYPTLCEAYSLVLGRLGTGRAHGWLSEVEGYASLVNPTRQDYQRACERILAYRDQDLSLFDAVAAVMGERLSVAVWTYDYHFHVMGVEVWPG